MADPVDPVSLSGRVLDVDASTIALPDGTPLTSVDDLSGTCTLTGAGVALPLYRANVQNGKGAISGERDNGGFEIAGAPALSGDYTILWVLRSTGTAFWQNVLGQGSSRGFWVEPSPGEFAAYFDANHPTTGMPQGVTSIVSAQRDSSAGTMTLSINGVVNISTLGVGGGDDWSFTPNGLMADGGSGGEIFSGYLFRLIVFDRALASAELDGVTQFLSDEWLALRTMVAGLTRRGGPGQAVEPELIEGRRAFPVTQQAFAGSPIGLPRELVVGWHDTSVNPEAGAFALVSDQAALDDLIGEIVRVSFQGRQVFAYVLQDAVLPDGVAFSLARRAFMGIARPSLEALSPAEVVVVDS